MEPFRNYIELVGTGIDAMGVLVVVSGALYATAKFLLEREQTPDTSFRIYRQNTMETVSVLGVIVFIRTFLSMSLQLELEGRWPWQARRTDMRSQT